MPNAFFASPQVRREAALSQRRYLAEQSATPPLAEAQDLEDIKALAHEARSQLSSLADVVSRLDGKVKYLEQRQRLHDSYKRRREVAAINAATSSSIALGRIEAVVATTGQAPQDGEASARPPAAPSTDSPPWGHVSSDLDDTGIMQAIYLNRFFPDVADLPCYLLIAITEHLCNETFARLYSEPSGRPSIWRKQLKGAIEAIFEFKSYDMPGRDSWGFQLLAEMLALRSHDDVPALHPSKLLDIQSGVDDDEDDSLKRVCQVTVDLLMHLNRLPEVLPPLYRTILASLGVGGHLTDEEEDWDIIPIMVVRSLRQLLDQGNAYDVCDTLEVQEVKPYVKMRLEGATRDAALQAFMTSRQGGNSRQKKRARRGR